MSILTFYYLFYSFFQVLNSVSAGTGLNIIHDTKVRPISRYVLHVSGKELHDSHVMRLNLNWMVTHLFYLCF